MPNGFIDKLWVCNEMISNSRMQTTLLSFLFKKINIIKKGIHIKDIHWNYMLSCLVVSYTQKPSGFKAIIKLTFVKVGSLLLRLLADSFDLSFWESFWNLQNLAKMRTKMKYICKKFINHQIKKCLLFRWRHAVVIMQTLNWTNQYPLFMTVRHIFEISEDDHPSLVTNARDHWWTLDFANAFVSPSVNSRGN
jgi:hypothetical protein